MKRLLLPLLVLTVTAFAGEPDKSPSVWVRKTGFTYPGTYSAASDIDFENFTLYYGTEEVPLHKGRWYRQSSLGYSEVKLTAANWVTDSQPGTEFAVLQLKELDCGGSCSASGHILVLRLASGRLTLVQHIQFDGNHGSSRFNPERLILTIRAANYGGGPNACPEYLDIMKYRWTGEKFAYRSRKTIRVGEC